MAKLKGQLFARLALDYFDHPKIMSLSAEAIVAHLEMIVYSRKYGTDGAIPMRFAMRFAPSVLDELASNDENSPSIIRNDDGSVEIYGYANMQETSDQIEKRRQARRDAGRVGASARWQKNANGNANRMADRMKIACESDGKKMAETETETETYITSGSSGEDTRPDILEILDHLDARLEDNNLKKPNRVKSNIDAARRLLDRDGRTVDEVKRIIDYAQSTEFWIPNVRSMSKLREKWDTLSSQAGFAKPANKPFDLWNSGGPI